ncbi:MAG TPA: phytanoyl-CoA dioxygenase family protein [Pseudomonadales bacterium]
MSTPPITPQQKTFFDVFGYLVFPGLFRDRIAAITEAFDAMFREHEKDIVPWQHVVHGDKQRYIMPGVIDRSPLLKALSEDALIKSMVDGVLGEPNQLIGTDGNIYECGTRWHTDITGLPYNCRNVKVIFYLDPMRAGEDAFRIIPGSHNHTDRFAKNLKQSIKTVQDTMGIEVNQVPSAEIPTVPGDVVMFDARAWHCVPYVGNRRRMMSFIFADKDYVPQETNIFDYR